MMRHPTGHQDFMRLAIEKAREGICQGQTPFGACVVRRGKVLSCEHNTVWLSTDITAHAEMNAIRAACKKAKAVFLKGSTIYSTCEPCPMCFSACHWAGISRIVYGARIQDAKRSGFRELTISNKKMKACGHSLIRIRADFMRREAQELFSLWQQQKRKRAY